MLSDLHSEITLWKIRFGYWYFDFPKETHPIHFNTGSLVPQETRTHGPRANAAYPNALQNGMEYRFPMLSGQNRTGKILIKSIAGIPFGYDEESTEVVTVVPSKCEVEIDQVKNWQCTEQMKLDVSGFKEDISKMIARDLKESENADQNTTDSPGLEQVTNTFSNAHAVTLPKTEVH